MDFRFSLLLVLLGISYAITNARDLGTSDVTHVEEVSKSYIQSNLGDTPLCELCKEYASQALDFLSKNETQSEILGTLYEGCSSLVPLKDECIYLVDHYVTLFFEEISDIEPDDLCEKAKLCKDDVSLLVTENSEVCSLCHNVVVEALFKLKDPDTQLEVVKTLVKSCSKLKSFVDQCKTAVVHYVPFILLNAETVLETNDVCNTIHACKASQEVSTLALASA